jgi:hypothetical protein
MLMVIIYKLTIHYLRGWFIINVPYSEAKIGKIEIIV